jgi:hypothetical protein
MFALSPIQPDVDHKLLKTLQLSQYSVQYLRSCQKAMTNNKVAINEALKVFDDEEAILDLKLARMRSILYCRCQSPYCVPFSNLVAAHRTHHRSAVCSASYRYLLLIFVMHPLPCPLSSEPALRHYRERMLP